MAITPTYSWPLPDNDDLVKDGAEAIRDLGNAIDTTVGGLSGAGLVHINTTSFSGVAAQNFNNVFTSTYDNYIIYGSTISSSATESIIFRLRASGTTKATDYTYNRIFTTSNAVGVSNLGNSNSTTGFLFADVLSTTKEHRFIMNVFKPKALKETYMLSETMIYNGTSSIRVLGNGMLKDELAYDGFTLLVNAGGATFTSGEVSIFGVAK